MPSAPCSPRTNVTLGARAPGSATVLPLSASRRDGRGHPGVDAGRHGGRRPALRDAGLARVRLRRSVQPEVRADERVHIDGRGRAVLARGREPAPDGGGDVHRRRDDGVRVADLEQRAQQLRRLLVAPRRIARERLDEHVVERGRQRGAPRRRRGDGHRANALDDGVDVAAAEQLLAREQLVHDDGRREEIGARVERLAARLLGRHVRPLPHDALGAVAAPHGRGAAVGGGARDAEVGDLHLARARQQDVRRRDVAVHDPARVREVEPFAHLHGHVHRGAERHAALRGGGLEEGPQVGAVDVLHGDVERAREAAEVEDLDDVRVRQRDGELGLGDEPVLELGVAREVGEDALDGERLLEAVRAVRLGAEDLGHPAHGDALEEIVTRGRLFSFGHARLL